MVWGQLARVMLSAGLPGTRLAQRRAVVAVPTGRVRSPVRMLDRRRIVYVELGLPLGTDRVDVRVLSMTPAGGYGGARRLRSNRDADGNLRLATKSGPSITSNLTGKILRFPSLTPFWTYGRFPNAGVRTCHEVLPCVVPRC